MFSMLTGAGAIAKNKFAVARRVPSVPIAKVDVQPPEFHVVNQSDLSLFAPDATAQTSAEASQLLDELVAANPSLRGRLQVMSSYELDAAA
jgi:hypothetical protein